MPQQFIIPAHPGGLHRDGTLRPPMPERIYVAPMLTPQQLRTAIADILDGKTMASGLIPGRVHPWTADLRRREQILRGATAGVVLQ